MNLEAYQPAGLSWTAVHPSQGVALEPVFGEIKRGLIPAALCRGMTNTRVWTQLRAWSFVESLSRPCRPGCGTRD